MFMRVLDFVSQGGTIMWILLLLNITGLSLIFWRLYTLWDFKKNYQAQLAKIAEGFKVVPTLGQPLEIVKDYVSSKVVELEVGMGMIKIIATISPLLGLLGTVVGIFDAFQVISLKGLANPADFAEGISLALITTIGGLIVAIPHYIAHNVLSGQLDKIEFRLERDLANTIK